jgi:hypothetical protein
MPAIEQTIALLEGITRDEVEVLPPARRRLLADRCRHLAQLAEPHLEPKAGVLAALKDGARAE